MAGVKAETSDNHSTGQENGLELFYREELDERITPESQARLPEAPNEADTITENAKSNLVLQSLYYIRLCHIAAYVVDKDVTFTITPSPRQILQEISTVITKQNLNDEKLSSTTKQDFHAKLKTLEQNLLPYGADNYALSSDTAYKEICEKLKDLNFNLKRTALKEFFTSVSARLQADLATEAELAVEAKIENLKQRAHAYVRFCKVAASIESTDLAASFEKTFRSAEKIFKRASDTKIKANLKIIDKGINSLENEISESVKINSTYKKDIEQLHELLRNDPFTNAHYTELENLLEFTIKPKLEKRFASSIEKAEEVKEEQQEPIEEPTATQDVAPVLDIELQEDGNQPQARPPKKLYIMATENVVTAPHYDNSGDLKIGFIESKFQRNFFERVHNRGNKIVFTSDNKNFESSYKQTMIDKKFIPESMDFSCYTNTVKDTILLWADLDDNGCKTFMFGTGASKLQVTINQQAFENNSPAVQNQLVRLLTILADNKLTINNSIFLKSNFGITKITPTTDNFSAISATNIVFVGSDYQYLHALHPSSNELGAFSAFYANNPAAKAEAAYQQQTLDLAQLDLSLLKLSLYERQLVLEAECANPTDEFLNLASTGATNELTALTRQLDSIKKSITTKVDTKNAHLASLQNPNDNAFWKNTGEKIAKLKQLFKQKERQSKNLVEQYQEQAKQYDYNTETSEKLFETIENKIQKIQELEPNLNTAIEREGLAREHFCANTNSISYTKQLTDEQHKSMELSFEFITDAIRAAHNDYSSSTFKGKVLSSHFFGIPNNNAIAQLLKQSNSDSGNSISLYTLRQFFFDKGEAQLAQVLTRAAYGQLPPKGYKPTTIAQHAADYIGREFAKANDIKPTPSSSKTQKAQGSNIQGENSDTKFISSADEVSVTVSKIEEILKTCYKDHKSSSLIGWGKGIINGKPLDYKAWTNDIAKSLIQLINGKGPQHQIFLSKVIEMLSTSKDMGLRNAFTEGFNNKSNCITINENVTLCNRLVRVDPTEEAQKPDYPRRAQELFYELGAEYGEASNNTNANVVAMQY